MAMGIPFIDLIHLRKSNIKNSYIIYHRRKTKRQAKVHIEPCLQEIIDRFYSEDSKYIFPLLAADNNNDRAYHSLLARYNRALAKIAGMAGINTKITSYTARHTWASIAYRIGGSLGAISKALTHKSPVTTQNYLKELDDRDVFEVNKLVLKEIRPQINSTLVGITKDTINAFFFEHPDKIVLVVSPFKCILQGFLGRLCQIPILDILL